MLERYQLIKGLTVAKLIGQQKFEKYHRLFLLGDCLKQFGEGVHYQSRSDLQSNFEQKNNLKPNGRSKIIL
jgi:CTP-dependent riboflavin kinase